MSGLIIRHDEGSVRTLTLNRPEKLNALSSTLVEDLSIALTETAGDPEIRAVIIAGAGRSFCAGYDLAEDAPVGDEAIARSLRQSLERLLEIYDLPQPVIARVQGHCLAGGCDLMMMCDLVVASDDAIFGQPEIRFGSAVVAQALPWLIGARRAKELVLAGGEIDAPTALDYGLVNRVVPAADLEPVTHELARTLAMVDPGVMRLTKRSVNAGWEEAGFRRALVTGVDLAAEIESTPSPERAEFDRIVTEQGLKEAVRWRDERFKGPRA